MTDLRTRRDRVFRALEWAASLGQACPTNEQIAELLGHASSSIGSQMLSILQREGRIVVHRGQCSRWVTIVATGLSTAKPATQRPHWRDRTDVRAPAAPRPSLPRTPSPRHVVRPRVQAEPEPSPSRFVDRDPCPRCRVRRDVGCQHTRAPISMGAF
jgi:hypothetical protein